MIQRSEREGRDRLTRDGDWAWLPGSGLDRAWHLRGPSPGHPPAANGTGPPRPRSADRPGGGEDPGAQRAATAGRPWRDRPV